MPAYSIRFSLLLVLLTLGITSGVGCGSERRVGAPLLSPVDPSGASPIEAVLDSAAVVAAVRLVQVLPLSTLVQSSPGDTVLFRAVSEVDAVYAVVPGLPLSPERALPESGGRLTYTFLALYTSVWRKSWPVGGEVLVALRPIDPVDFGRAPWRAAGTWPLTPELRAFVGGWQAQRGEASVQDADGR